MAKGMKEKQQIDDKRNLVREIAQTAYLTCQEVVQLLCTFEEGNTAHTCAALEGKPFVLVSNLITKALLQRAIMSLMRLHDKASRDRNCLSRAFKILDEQAVVDLLSQTGGNAERLGAAIESWKNTNNDCVLEKLRNLRDGELAHDIPILSKSSKPTLDELRSAISDTLEVVENLAAGTGVVCVSFSAIREVWKPKAASYWEYLRT